MPTQSDLRCPARMPENARRRPLVLYRLLLQCNNTRRDDCVLRLREGKARWSQL